MSARKIRQQSEMWPANFGWGGIYIYTVYIYIYEQHMQWEKIWSISLVSQTYHRNLTVDFSLFLNDCLCTIPTLLSIHILESYSQNSRQREIADAPKMATTWSRGWMENDMNACWASSFVFDPCIALHRLGAFKQKAWYCAVAKNELWTHWRFVNSCWIENARFPKVKGNTSLPEGAWNSRFKAIEFHWISTIDLESDKLPASVEKLAADKKSANDPKRRTSGNWRERLEAVLVGRSSKPWTIWEVEDVGPEMMYFPTFKHLQSLRLRKFWLSIIIGFIAILDIRSGDMIQSSHTAPMGHFLEEFLPKASDVNQD